MASEFDSFDSSGFDAYLTTSHFARGGGPKFLVFGGLIRFDDPTDTAHNWGYLDGTTLKKIGNNAEWDIRDSAFFVRQYKSKLYMFGGLSEVLEATAQASQASILTVDATPANNTFTVTIEDAEVSQVGDTDPDTTAVALVVSLNASVNPNFSVITWTNPSGALIVGVADTENVPFTAVMSVTDTGMDEATGTVSAFFEKNPAAPENPNSPNFHHCAKFNKSDGIWETLQGTDLAGNATVFDVALNKDTGNLVVCGNYGSLDGDQTLAFIAEYDGTNWISMGSSAFNPTIFDSSIDTCSPWKGTVVASDLKDQDPMSPPGDEFHIGVYNGDETWSRLDENNGEPAGITLIRNIKVTLPVEEGEEEEKPIDYLMVVASGGNIFTWTDEDAVFNQVGDPDSTVEDLTSWSKGVAIGGTFTKLTEDTGTADIYEGRIDTLDEDDPADDLFRIDLDFFDSVDQIGLATVELTAAALASAAAASPDASFQKFTWTNPSGSIIRAVAIIPGEFFDGFLFNDGLGLGEVTDFAEPSGEETDAKRVAFWNGLEWAQIGSGFDNGTVKAIWEHEERLYAAGDFTLNGEAEECRYLAVFDEENDKWIEPYVLTEGQEILNSTGLLSLQTFSGQIEK